MVKNNSVGKGKTPIKFLQMEWNSEVMFLLLGNQFASL